MAKKRQNTEISKAKVKKLFKDCKIKECHVDMLRLTVTNNVAFKQALFRKYGIRECVVRLNKMSENDILAAASKKKLQLAPKIGTVRSNVSWIPTSSLTQKNSADALSELATYRTQHDVVPRLNGKNVKRQRAKSMFVERIEQSSNGGGKKFTMDDMHIEFNERFSSPNRGLKSCAERQLFQRQGQPLSDREKIHKELQAKIDAKNAPKPPPLPPNGTIMKAELPWEQLKALQPKKYPVVQCSVEPTSWHTQSITADAEGASLAYEEMNQAIEKSYQSLFKRWY